MSIQTKLDNACESIIVQLKKMPDNFTKVSGISPLRDENNLIRRLLSIYLGSCFEVNNAFYKEFRKCGSKEVASVFLHIIRLNQCLMSDLGKLLGTTWKIDHNSVEASQNYPEKFSLETLSLKDLTKHAVVWLYLQIFISEEIFKTVNPAILHCSGNKLKLSYFHVKWLLESETIKNAKHKSREIPKFRKNQLAKLKNSCEILFGEENSENLSYFDDILDSQVEVFEASVGKVKSYGSGGKSSFQKI